MSVTTEIGGTDCLKYIVDELYDLLPERGIKVLPAADLGSPPCDWLVDETRISNVMYDYEGSKVLLTFDDTYHVSFLVDDAIVTKPNFDERLCQFYLGPAAREFVDQMLLRGHKNVVFGRRPFPSEQDGSRVTDGERENIVIRMITGYDSVQCQFKCVVSCSVSSFN